MNQIYFSQKTNSGFYGIPQQITDKIKEHETTTKIAIDFQTETLESALTIQTNTLQETINNQTEIQHQDSVALKQQQAQDAGLRQSQKLGTTSQLS